jgi:hypothetical protein
MWKPNLLWRQLQHVRNSYDHVETKLTRTTVTTCSQQLRPCANQTYSDNSDNMFATVTTMWKPGCILTTVTTRSQQLRPYGNQTYSDNSYNTFATVTTMWKPGCILTTVTTRSQQLRPYANQAVFNTRTRYYNFITTVNFTVQFSEFLIHYMTPTALRHSFTAKELQHLLAHVRSVQNHYQVKVGFTEEIFSYPLRGVKIEVYLQKCKLICITLHIYFDMQFGKYY